MKLQMQISLYLKVPDGVGLGYTKITYFINVLKNSCYPSDGNNPNIWNI
jgi:hypothetical protein